MDRIDFSNLGGLPVTQYSLLFMQTACRDAFGGIARLAGNKSIVAGVEVTAGNVSNGWISYNNELIPFIGGALGTDVVITESSEPRTYQDGTEYEVYFKKVARCGVVGEFPFSDLVRLQSLQNIWLPGDLKDKYCTMQYYQENFDGNGYGMNKEIGWRVFSKQVPEAAGRVFVNLDPNDADFNTIGWTGGEKKHILNRNEIPSYNISVPRYKKLVQAPGSSGSSLAWWDTDTTSVAAGGYDQAHNNLQPYFVILKLIKL